MRDPDARHYALECLKLAIHNIDKFSDGLSIIGTASKLLAFVTGDDQDEALAKLEEVRKAGGWPTSPKA